MRKAIVLGGTHDHIQLINQLKERGYYTILADYLDHPPAKMYADEFAQKSILNKGDILELAIEKDASLVIATCIDQAFETSAYVSEKLSLPCHVSFETALNLTNKKYMKTKMVEIGIPTSNFSVFKERREVFDIGKLNYPLVIKPVDANSSKGVFKIEREEQLDSFFYVSKSFSKTGEVIIEEFVEGKELSVDVFIRNGETTILMITENVKSKINKHSFTIIESYYNKGVEEELKDNIKIIANNIAKAFNIKNGPLLIQCIYNENQNQISVIEFSSRIGGGSKHLYIRTITGFDILSVFIDSILGSNIEKVNVKSQYTLGKIKYLYTHPGVISEFQNFEVLKQTKVLFEYFTYKTPGSNVEEALKSTDRCAGILIVSNEKNDFVLKEEIALSKLKVLNEKGENFLL